MIEKCWGGASTSPASMERAPDAEDWRSISSEIYVIETEIIGYIDPAIVNLQSQVSTLQSRVALCEVNIASNTGRLTTDEAAITALQSRLTTDEAIIASHTISINMLKANPTWTPLSGLTASTGYNTPAYSKVNVEIVLRGVAAVTQVHPNDVIASRVSSTEEMYVP